ncbi:putative B3 domain-containing protein Os03g0621600 [Chenopodium quinoa]|uniref:putative B3 domain-containing protein Os03g0621600 n=1 Tax=Chenopodium quinoa TaxID=63459 RepID=UPI000B770519|nr:putative B3 domain-containing protein Os03g0621600 [Chenopodium quinoa]
MEFVKKYGRQLSNDIYLNVQNSEHPWKVTLEKSNNNNIFLEKGWQNFMEFYSINYGHFLLFRFDEGLVEPQFHVFIFDKSATEIDYPVRNSSSSFDTNYDSEHLERNYETEEKIEKNDVSVEIMDEIKPDINDVASIVSLDDTLDSTHSSTDDVASSSFKSEEYDYISPDLKKKLKRKLDGITSQHPHFKRIIYPSNVRDQKKLRVPLEHVSNYFPRKSKEIILKGPNGKSHHVRFYIGKACELIGGWRRFASDNDLMIGDICMFELINPCSYSYKVSIFRS